MTDESVRRKLFWLLQRLSSYSLWRRKRDAWAYFVQRYESALKTWPEDKTDGFHPRNIIWAYDTLRLYDEGLVELAQGNRQVWQIKSGEFYQLFHSADLVESNFYLPCHERGVQREPYPPEVDHLNTLRLAATYWGDNLMYPPHGNASNIYDAAYLLDAEYYSYNSKQLAYPFFSKNLPPVPEDRDIIIKTGEAVPCDGIWEPVKIQYNHKLLIIKTDINGFKNLGAYNYFIRGMNAPLQVYEDMLLAEGWGYRDVHWRLVWEDNRYCDGIIPNESEYFLHEAQGKRIQCRTGDKCPHSGQWATLAGGHQQFAYVREGDNMPEAKVYTSGTFSPDQFTSASWSLMVRDDDGSVFMSATGEKH